MRAWRDWGGYHDTGNVTSNIEGQLRGFADKGVGRWAPAALKAEVACKTIFDICSDTMVQKGFEPLSSHAGHGLGLEHPEPPALVQDSTDTLLRGDVVTLEPGNYIQGIGGVRIERNYLVTKTGSENLSHHKIALQ